MKYQMASGSVQLASLLLPDAIPVAGEKFLKVSWGAGDLVNIHLACKKASI